MSIYSDPAFVAAEIAYRYERDRVRNVPRPRARRPRRARTPIRRRLSRILVGGGRTEATPLG